MRHPFLFFALPLATLGSFTYLTVAKAQITPDNSLGAESSVVTPNVQINGTPSDRIDGGAIRGDNLFHSFQEFNINAGRGAYFSNPSGIANILTRVTGSNLSNIQGVLGVLGSANLFLINPNGIIFGPNARLDMGGSFLGSTANSLIFKNGFEFSASNPQAPPLLTINVPIGLGFRDNPKEIKVEKGPGHNINFKDDIKKPEEQVPVRVNNTNPGLQLESGKTLALVGGKVTLEGAILNSSSGRIEIGSVASNGTVSLVPVQEGWKLGYESIGNFGDIEFSRRTLLDTKGVGGVGGGSIAVAGKNINFTGESVLLADTFGDRNGGEISIVGDKISVNNSDISSKTFGSGNAGQINLIAKKSILLENNGGGGVSTIGLGKAGEITLKADSIEIRKNSGAGSHTYGKGNAGRIEIQANSLLIENQAGFGASSYAQGNAGEINIVVGKFEVRNQAGLGANANSTGNGGKINVRANSLQISDRAGFTSTTKEGSTGQGGEVNINVAGPLELRKESSINNNTFGAGNAGKINITANSLRISDGGGLKNTTEKSATGQGGEINVDVKGPVVIQNGVGINNDTSGSGNAGKINITANSLRISDNVGVTNDTKPGSIGQGGEINFNVAGPVELQNSVGINSNTTGTGNAGKISIKANSLLISDKVGVTTNTEKGSTGQGGEINLNITGPVVLEKQANINSSTSGRGNAGKIDITANSLQISDRSGFSSDTKQGSTGQGGEINVDVAGSVVVQKEVGINNDTYGAGNAGKITIKANSLQISDRSGVTSTAKSGSTGQGGEIIVKVTGPLVLQNAGINSNTESSGNAGQITVRAQSLEISNSGAISTSTTRSGKAGNLDVEAKTLILDNDGKLRVSSTGSGDAGTLKVVADTIKLNNQSSIDATTTSGNGGNLTLDVANLLLLRRESRISATAGTKDAPGNGGEITINTPKGIIVAFPNENSDITANSFNGNGGKITIRTQGLFGIQPRSQLTPESDITAFSQQNPSLNGTINIITPDVDPTRGLFELSETVIDAAQQIAQNPCIKGFGSSFTIVGRGGIPTDPKKILSSDNVRVDLVKPAPSTVSSTSATQKQPSQKPPVKEIIPARGWIFNEKGEVLLVGYDPTKTGVQRPQPAPSSSCAAVK